MITVRVTLGFNVRIKVRASLGFRSQLSVGTHEGEGEGFTVVPYKG